MRRGAPARTLAVGAALLAVSCALAVARQNPPAQPAHAPDVPRPAKPAHTWTIEYEEAVHSDKTGEGSAKNVVVTTDEGTVLHAKDFTWNDKTKVAHASGDLRMTDPQADAVGADAEIQYARDKKLVIMTGGVHITLKPKEKGAPKAGSSKPAAAAPSSAQQKPDAPSDEDTVATSRRYPVEVTCDRVEYQYAQAVKHAVLTGSFKAVQKLPDKTRTLRAEKAEWFGVEEKIILHGPVHWEDTRGQTGDTKNDVTIFTKEGDERLQTTGGKITIPVDEDEEKPATGTTGDKAGSPPSRDEKKQPPPENGQAPPGSRP